MSESITKSNVKCHSSVPQRAMSNVRVYHKEQCQMSESITKSNIKCQSRVPQRAMSNVIAVSTKSNVKCQSVSQRAMSNVREYHKEQCQMSEQSSTKSNVKCHSSVPQRAMSKQSLIKSTVKCQSRVPQRAMSNVRAKFRKEQCQMSRKSFTKSDVKGQTFYLLNVSPKVVSNGNRNCSRISPNNNVMSDSILVADIMPVIVSSRAMSNVRHHISSRNLSKTVSNVRAVLYKEPIL